jgi:signal transduction histidine kinase
MRKEYIAIIGAGKGGTAILETLLKMPNIATRYVCDVNPQAPGMLLAAKNGIACQTDPAGIYQDAEIDLIFEVTGRREVYQKILEQKAERTRVIGSADAQIIFHLLDMQREVMNQLKVSNLALEQRVLDRTLDLEKANRELENRIAAYEMLNEKLHQINNEKTKYLMHATHQLKAPFAAIQSYTDLILEGYTGSIPKMTLEIIGKIKERCIMLSNSIQDMLELANLKSLVMENVHLAPCSLDGIIASVVNHLADLAAARQIKIEVPPVGRDIRVKCNRNQILILLSNLLENAIYYSPGGATVTLAVDAAAPSFVKLAVIDQGIGIDAKNLGRIFDEYFRANQAVAVNQQGNGLGLAIAREIAQIHHTTIEVESTLGKGSTFSFRLPKA